MRKLFSIILFSLQVAALIATIFAFCATIPPKIDHWRGMQRKRDELSQKIEETKEAISQLKIKQQRFKSDSDFVEHIARQNRRVQSEELIFIFDKKGTDR